MDQPDQSLPSTEEPSDSSRTADRARLPVWIARPLRWCWNALRSVGQFLLIAWITLAVFYSNLPWPWMRTLLAVAIAIFAIWAMWVTRRRRMRWALAGVFAVVLIWWICIPPSHDRPWRRDVAVLPRAIIDGDRVRLVNYRNFVYRSRTDFDEHYEERDIRLSHVVSFDLFISYWMPGPVAHTFVSFNFDDGTPPVCISIEARPEVGEQFEPISSMFKQFELIYVVGDERDLVGSRTEHRNEEVFLYHIRAPEGVRRLFSIYLDRINQLAERPEWYHLLSNNCTLNILRYARAAGGRHGRFDIRYLLNGLLDRYLYGLGIVDTSLGFEELRRRSHINDAAHAAIAAHANAKDFSAQIRASLPVPAPAGSNGDGTN